MRIAILCPGASVATFPGRSEFDAVIGVNRAVGFTECDYWVLTDKFTYVLSVESGSPCVGLPTMATDKSIYRTVCYERADAKRFAFLDIQETCKGISNKKWGLYSATRALALSLSLGASKVVAYGVDWDSSHPQDWDGFHDHRQKRTQVQFYDRQDSQSERWGRMVAVLAELGVSVHRCQEVHCGA